MILSNQLEGPRVRAEIIRIHRTGVADEYSSGVPAAFSSDLLLFREIATDQFCFDGFGIYRLDDIDLIRNGPFERFYEQLLAREGVTTPQGDSPSLDITNWCTALQHLAERRTLVALQGELLPEPEYWVGHILEVDAASLLIRSLDGLGQWDPEPIEFPTSEVTQVSFGSKYLRVFSDAAPR
jgi:hypothetical protein